MNFQGNVLSSNQEHYAIELTLQFAQLAYTRPQQHLRLLHPANRDDAPHPIIEAPSKHGDGHENHAPIVSTKESRAYALLITIVFIGIALLLLGSVMDWSNSTARQTERNNLFSMSTGAAEAATERVIAQMSRDFYNQALNSATNYMRPVCCPTTTGWPVQFSFGNPFNNVD